MPLLSKMFPPLRERHGSVRRYFNCATNLKQYRRKQQRKTIKVSRTTNQSQTPPQHDPRATSKRQNVPIDPTKIPGKLGQRTVSSLRSKRDLNLLTTSSSLIEQGRRSQPPDASDASMTRKNQPITDSQNLLRIQSLSQLADATTHRDKITSRDGVLTRVLVLLGTNGAGGRKVGRGTTKRP